MIMENKNYRQQGFCDSGAKLQSSTAVLRFNFSAKLKFCASIAPPLQSPETLYAMLLQTMYIKRNKKQQKMKNNTPTPKFILFSSTFFANAHQHICKKPTEIPTLILQKS